MTKNLTKGGSKMTLLPLPIIRTKYRKGPRPGYRRVQGIEITVDVRHNSFAESMYNDAPVCLVKD